VASPSSPRAWEFAATGTRWRIHHSGAVSLAAARELAAAVAADEARWSRFRADSELSELNAHAGRWRGVSPETFTLLEACERYQVQSDGVFDPLVGGLMPRWGYGQSISESSPYTERTPEAEPVSGRLELDPEGHRVRLPAGVALDLGGIGKGWIAQRLGPRVAELCDDPGVLIDAGGDLLAVSGEHRVGVEAAEDPGGHPHCWIRLRAPQAVATSGDNRRSWHNGDGVRVHHLIDPATGAPGPSAQATVVAGDAVSADVYAKVLALRPLNVAAFAYPALVVVGGVVRESPGWASVVAGSPTRAAA
jgi:thiamine biosynthesis lipoprotein